MATATTAPYCGRPFLSIQQPWHVTGKTRMRVATATMIAYNKHRRYITLACTCCVAATQLWRCIGTFIEVQQYTTNLIDQVAINIKIFFDKRDWPHVCERVNQTCEVPLLSFFFLLSFFSYIRKNKWYMDIRLWMNRQISLISYS